MTEHLMFYSSTQYFCSTGIIPTTRVSSALYITQIHTLYMIIIIMYNVCNIQSTGQWTPCLHYTATLLLYTTHLKLAGEIIKMCSTAYSYSGTQRRSLSDNISLYPELSLETDGHGDSENPPKFRLVKKQKTNFKGKKLKIIKYCN